MHSRASLDELKPPGCCARSSSWPSCRTCLEGEAAVAGSWGARVSWASTSHTSWGPGSFPSLQDSHSSGCPGLQWRELSEESAHSKSCSRPRLSGGNPFIPGVEGWLQSCSKVDLCWSPSPSWVPPALKSQGFLELGRRAKTLVPGVGWMGGRFRAPT